MDILFGKTSGAFLAMEPAIEMVQIVVHHVDGNSEDDSLARIASESAL